ncbi:LLM class flavin-dependent oxidoreductase [Pseudomonas sp. R5(2019)]|uniref:LLM class flavin-dependent oxidoreductase n=1 Tax=Pseudomonas sp. R5(2019) TaxID=2697566 RepID=UPI0014128FB4|nr:LLM class flavin-dependent oxidoreductase [Pseudomonas sp. R5(2019)]NBA93567.1 NtaA/DmoA family FMN-dependent monooxygenase [Pseudomonas sp. R5(2019)]
MNLKKQLHLAAFMRPVAIHTGSWRYPDAAADANFNFPLLRSLAQTLEAACFDAFFMADHLGVLNMPMEALRRSHTVTSFEPFTLLSALAASTQHIGLVATASTTYDEPYHVARRFASLDHISGGRAGWNIVTTSNPESALNFGLSEQPEHGSRYARAREFYDVVTGLWDSFEDDAFVRNKESGVYFDPTRMHVLNHKGPNFSVRGPLNIARPPQGRPVIVQAGGSDAGRQLAAETAEWVFAAVPNLDAGKAFYEDVKGRAVAAGRSRDDIKITPAAFVVVGDTLQEAVARRVKLDSLVHYESGIRSLCQMLDYDVSKYDPDGPLPPIPQTNANKTQRSQIMELAAEPGITIRDLAAKAGSHTGLSFVGTPAMIADDMQRWLVEGGSDGFIIMFSDVPHGVTDFAEKVVPELQRRGIFRTEYEGLTLREHLGFERPVNQFLL